MLKKIFVILSLVAFGSCKSQQTEDVASQTSAVGINTGLKLSFAPPWWLADYPQFMTQGNHFAELKNHGYDTLKLWLRHINPGFYIKMDEGTFGYKCDISSIFEHERDRCPYYFQAVDAINFSGLNVDVEVGMENTRLFYGDNCQISGRDKALEYAKKMAELHFNNAFKPWLIAGGKVRNIILDGPLDKSMRFGNAGRGCGFDKMDDALLATMTYMELIRDNFKRANLTVQFVHLVNLPHWKVGSYSSTSSPNHDRKGDFLELIKKFSQESKNRGLNLVGFEVDNPLSYTLDLKKRSGLGGLFGGNRDTVNQMNRLKLVQQAVQQQGKEFRFITITDTKHIEESMFPLVSNESENKLFVNETTFYADFLRANFGNYLHNITLQSWLAAPNYIFKKNGPEKYGMFHNALQIGKRANKGFCSLDQYATERGRSFVTLAQAVNDYVVEGIKNKTCMPVNNPRDGSCSPYYFLLTHPEAIDRTLDAVEYYNDKGGKCKPVPNTNPWMYETDYNGRRTRMLHVMN